MVNWFNSLTIIIIIGFFIEILIARQIYRKTRQGKQSNDFAKQHLLLVFTQPNQNQGQPLHSTNNNKLDTNLQPHIQEIILPSANQSPYKHSWSQFALYACVSSIFTITFLVVNYLNRPYTFQWGLIFLPLLVPLPFLTVPYILELKTYSTFSLFLSGLGFGLFLLLIL